MEQVKQLVIEGKYRQISSAVQCALENGYRPQQILQAMAEALETVGECFQSGDIFVPEMLISAKTMKDGVKVLQPHLPRNQGTLKGKVIIGTVAGTSMTSAKIW